MGVPAVPSSHGARMLGVSEIAKTLAVLSPETEQLLRPLRNLHPHDRISIGVFKNLETFVVETYNAVSVNAEKHPPRSLAAQPDQWGQRIPEARRDQKNRLLLPATDFTALVICALWHSDRISFSSSDAEMVFRKLETQWQLYFVAAHVQAEYKSTDKLPDFVPRLPYKDEDHKPADYQIAAAYCASIVPGYALFKEQGTGKTFTSILAIEKRARAWAKSQAEDVLAGKISKARPYLVCVVCPKNVRTNWVDEIEKFSTLRNEVRIMCGEFVSRTTLLMETVAAQTKHCDISWLVMSYGILARAHDSLSAVPWNTALLDESHSICNFTTQRNKAAVKLRDAAAHRLVLTGTPMPNKASDFYTQFEFLGRGFSGFMSKDSFGRYYNKSVDNYDEHGRQARVVGIINAPLLQERLARMAFIVRKADVLKDLPPKAYKVIGVDMTPDQQRVYQNVLRDIVCDAEKELGGCAGDGRNYTMVLQNVLKQMLRLSQITSGFYVSDAVYDEDGTTVMQESETHRFDPNPKLEELIAQLKELPKTSKAIIWAIWKQDIKTIAARMRLEGFDFVTFYGETSDTDREEAKRRFNTDSKCQFWLGSPAAGGVGLNLLGQSDPETNCDTMFYYSQNWSSTQRSQSEDRPHRRGTRTHVQIIDLVVGGTIDEEIRERVTAKRANAAQLQDVREILTRLSIAAKTIGAQG